MRIRLNIEKNAHKNAAAYYEEAKEAKEKIRGAEKAAEETKKEIAAAENAEAKEEERKARETKVARKKEWYEKFHYFFTSGGKLVVGGRSADQNDLVFNRHFEEGDLFFHADIQGGSACVLKDGVNANEAELKEVAQFAACFSNAWKNGDASVDAYCVGKGQVSKHAQGGFIARGAFAILGERIWFRKTELKLKAGLLGGIAVVLPANCARKLEKEVFLTPGNEEKGEIVRELAKMLGAHPDDVQNILPGGRGKILKL